MFEQDSALSHRACKMLSFGPQDARFHVSMLLSADTISIFHQRTRLSSPSKQGSNWQHQLKLASLYLWHIMTSALHHD